MLVAIPVFRIELSGTAAGAPDNATVVREGSPEIQVQAAAGLPLVRVQSLMGNNVVGAAGRDAGEVENLLIDRAGNVRAAVVEWGGFLGIGENRAVVPISGALSPRVSWRRLRAP